MLHAQSSAQDAKDVHGAMNALRQAVMSKDRAALEKLMHPDLTYTHSSTKTETRTEAIDAIVSNKATQSFDFSESKVRVYNGAALVKGKVSVQSTVDGKAASPFWLIISHMWVKGPQGWQLVDRQATRPPQTPAP
jgi:ketosteroid isomerase-like protein